MVKYLWKYPYVCAYPSVFLLVHMCCVRVSCCVSWASAGSQASCTHPALCPLSPSDRLALCQERMIVFESCQDIKRGRSPTRGHVNNKLATSSKVRGNMTSQSASLIGSGLPCDEGMDGSGFNGVDRCLIHSPPEGNMCFVPIPCYIQISAEKEQKKR